MSRLPSLYDVTAWLAVLRDLRADPAQQSAAVANMLVAYARAYARAHGKDEGEAALEALERVRDTQGEPVAYDAAARADIDLDRLREERVEEQRHMEREAVWEGQP